ncbi:CYTH domain-containing protein [Catellatospora sichuanensis]|uniref:CYTH domain-containing protein n=1 Tax=Catellatospora sichuanensis TaxID=1969805 RepID=UPI0011837FFA|nr:CYTH domain-containing protein [Catellatospora sichuanensis]
MSHEIERKFLVTGDSWRDAVAESQSIRQGYLSVDAERVVRIRLVDEQHGFVTIKSKRVGYTRSEFEYAIPADDAKFLLDEMCLRPLLEKRRHLLSTPPGSWIVDEFEGAHAGLVVAEVELPSEDTAIDIPGWVSREVTHDDSYANSALVASAADR